VCVNGAVLYDAATDKVLTASTLDPLQLRDAADALQKALPGCLFAAERLGNSAAGDDQQFVAEPDYSYSWPQSEPSPDTRHAPLDEVLGQPAIKLLVRHPEMTSDVMAQAAAAAFGEAFSVTFSTKDGLIELAGAGLDKGTGLAAVASRLGVPAEDVIAFGDMPNDLPMLTWAGHGVAMANAHPAVLDVADEVTAPNSEDGVALVLERWWS
jgi:Cof subfamily protein (haloacid dehalogenase superfamily)